MDPARLRARSHTQESAGVLRLMGRWLYSSLLIAVPMLAGHRDFRNSDWGMSREQVIRAEGKPVSSSDSILEYSAADFLGAPARLLYVFTNNQLTRAICVFTADHADPN